MCALNGMLHGRCFFLTNRASGLMHDGSSIVVSAQQSTKTSMKSLKELFLDQLANRYDSESQLTRGMPVMVEAATSIHLQKLMRSHLEGNKQHVEKLRMIFKTFDRAVTGTKCAVTEGLLKECHRMVFCFKGSPVINAALVAASQKIKHFEIASYGCLHEWAGLLDNGEAVGLLEELLREEKTANQSLIKLARFRCNKEALAEAGREINRCDIYGHKIRNSLA